jgi:cyanate permease
VSEHSSSEEWQKFARTLIDELESVPPNKQIAFIRNKVEKLPPDLREPVSHFVTATIIAAKQGAVTVPDQGTRWWETVLAVGFGAVFIVALLFLAIFFPTPTPFQYEVFRIVLAAAVAGFAATIPGFLHIQIGNLIKAGGALAVFVVIYFYNPAQLVRSDSSETPSITDQ